MEKKKIVLTLILFELTFQQGKARKNITYYRERKSWKEAAQFCLKNGGVLESNIGNITHQFNYDDNGIWVGKYESLTPWKAVWGCFQINKYLRRFEIDSYDSIMCQKLCKDSAFFGVKKTKCICINSNIVPTTPMPFSPCNCSNCFLVMKQNITITTDNNKSHGCLAVDCPGYLRYVPAPCNLPYFLICDNGYRYNYSYQQAMQQKACFRLGSFIKWYETCSGGDGNLQAQHWTSATRTIHQFSLTEGDDIIEIHPTMCMKVHLTETGLSVILPFDCSEKLPFLCRFKNEDNGRPSSSITYQTTGFTGGDGSAKTSVGITNQPLGKAIVEDSPNYTGPIIGSVIAIIIIATVVTTVLIYRRRLHSKPPPKSNLVSNDDNYTTIEEDSNHSLNKTVSNPNYSFANPLEKEESALETKHIDSFDYSSGMCGVQNGHNGDGSKNQDSQGHISEHVSVSAMYAKPLRRVNKEIIKEHDKCKSDESQSKNDVFAVPGECPCYSVAELVNDEENDPYNANKDYDHLHNVKKKENPTYKVYDHLSVSMVSDPAYDHMHLNASTLSDGDYDHFTAKDGK